MDNQAKKCYKDHDFADILNEKFLRFAPNKFRKEFEKITKKLLKKMINKYYTILGIYTY